MVAGESEDGWAAPGVKAATEIGAIEGVVSSEGGTTDTTSGVVGSFFEAAIRSFKDTESDEEVSVSGVATSSESAFSAASLSTNEVDSSGSVVKVTARPHRHRHAIWCC